MPTGISDLIVPAGLNSGECIGIAAPASPFDPRALDRGIRVLEEMGFKVRWGADLHARQGYLAGSDPMRAGALMDLFRDPEVRAILCARGGYGTMRLLPLLDWEDIKAHPKLLVGFSDITVLLNLISQKAGVVTAHGPLVTELGKCGPETRDGLHRMLMGRRGGAIRPPAGRVLQSGEAHGPLWGGNLTLLTHLLGTPFAPRFRGAILVLEDRGEAPYRIDRMLWHLKLSGSLDRIAGLILGHFSQCGDMETIDRMVEELGLDPQLPVMAGFPFGHGEPNLTIPLGMKATLDTRRSVLEIHESVDPA